MIGASAATTSARTVLQSCCERPPENELLPLLALSVLATQAPFSAVEIGYLARRVASCLAAAGQPGAGDMVLGACAGSLERCRATEQAADLREAQAILRWESRRPGDR